FLVCRAVAQSGSSNGDADRVALLACMMPGGMFQSVVFAKALSGSATSAASAARTSQTHTASTAHAVKVPALGDRTERSEIERHFRDHRLRSRIFERPTPGITAPVVAHQWPERDADAQEGSEVQIVLLTPASGAKRG